MNDLKKNTDNSKNGITCTDPKTYGKAKPHLQSCPDDQWKKRKKGKLKQLR